MIALLADITPTPTIAMCMIDIIHGSCFWSREGWLLCRGSLYVEAAEGQAWGWYSPHQIPSLIAWLETGSQQEQQLAEELYTMYQPVLRLVAQPGQVCSCLCHL